MQSVEEIAAHYESQPRPPCPRCKTDEGVAFFVRGKPTSALLAYSERPDSRVRLGGCRVSADDPKYFCKICSQGFNA